MIAFITWELCGKGKLSASHLLSDKGYPKTVQKYEKKVEQYL